MLDTLLARRPPAYPQLAPAERVVAEARLGGETAVLTDRRVVITGRNFEQTMPLAHLAIVRCRFERIPRDFTRALVLLAVALALFVGAGPARTFFQSQSAALQVTVETERQTLPEGQRVAEATQSLVNAFAFAARALPLVAWLLVFWAIGQLALGVLGRTTVSVLTGSGEVVYTRRGHDRALQEFIAEVGRNVPPPGR